jgi:DMSO/TMAO reductase YedYZ molybdopterin-dependent catalytic subunit
MLSDPHSPWSLNRRQFLQQTTWLGLGALFSRPLLSRSYAAESPDTVTLPFANGTRPLVTYPQKRPLIQVTARPPQLETPFAVFNEGLFTPNDAFFVRYHLANIPTAIDGGTFELALGGNVRTPIRFSVADLKSQFEPVEVVAVNQCSGNSRGFFNPRVSGGQLGNGAMGNARWKGVPLRAVLDRVGVGEGARQVTFNGADEPVIPATPDFVKALDIDHARDGEVMIAYEMNGAELPLLNGYPLRLVVPGYYGTYWVKHLNAVTVVNDPFTGFWMEKAYRIPDTPGASITPGTVPKTTVPIARFNVRSFLTSHTDGASIQTGRETRLRGIAFDGGNGIRGMSFSPDGGRTWRDATLGKDQGRYSFREWTATFIPEHTGNYELKCRATTGSGETQPLTPNWNPAGYMRNVVEIVNVVAT